jgi:hypothetical protein
MLNKLRYLHFSWNLIIHCLTRWHPNCSVTERLQWRLTLKRVSKLLSLNFVTNLIKNCSRYSSSTDSGCSFPSQFHRDRTIVCLCCKWLHRWAINSNFNWQLWPNVKSIMELLLLRYGIKCWIVNRNVNFLSNCEQQWFTWWNQEKNISID